MKTSMSRLGLLLVAIYILAGCDASPSLKWKTRVGDTNDTAIVAPLEIGDNMVFVPASQPREGRYPWNAYEFMQAFDKNTGYFLWHYQLGRHPDIGGCGITKPVFDDGVVYIALNCSNIEAVDTTTGQKIWVFPPMGTIIPGKPIFAYPRIDQCSAPALTDELVYFLCLYSDTDAEMRGERLGNTDVMLALDRVSGYLVWEFIAPRAGDRQPIALTKHMVMFVDGEKTLHAVDRETGIGMWDFRADYGVTSPPFSTDDQVLTAGYYEGGPHIFILDEQTGDVRQKIPVMAESGTLDSVVAKGDVVYALLNMRSMTSFKGSLHALDLQSLEEKWRFDANSTIDRTSLIIDDNTIYISTYDTLFAIDRTTGGRKWQLTDRDVIVAPILSDGTIYIGNHAGFIYAIPAD